MSGEPVYVARGARERRLQRALLQYFKPENYADVRAALEEAGRLDLIGDGPECLIPARPPRITLRPVVGRAARRNKKRPSPATARTGKRPGEENEPCLTTDTHFSISAAAGGWNDSASSCSTGLARRRKGSNGRTRTLGRRPTPASRDAMFSG